MAKLVQLECLGSNLQPILVIMQTFVEIEINDRPGPDPPAPTFPSHSLSSTEHNLVSKVPDLNNHFGLSLLQHISTEISDLRLSKLVVPVAMIHNWEINTTFGSRGPITRPSRPYSGGLDTPTKSTVSNHKDLTYTAPVVNPRRLQKCLDAGAVDVLVSPLQPDRVYGLIAHAYRARNQASKERTGYLAANRLRKRPWSELGNYACLLDDMYVPVIKYSATTGESVKVG